ncbi:MAG: glycosyltransferase [Bacteroidota bacterium]
MSVLFIMPNWYSPSELWLHRMINMMEDEINTIACYNPAKKKYNGKIPAVNLFDCSFLARVKNKLNLTQQGNNVNYRGLNSVIKRNNIKKIFIHYLTSVVNLSKLIETSEIPVYIHCHGYDVIWDRKKRSGELIHPEDYVDMVRSLSDKVFFIANSHYTANKLKQIEIKEERIIVKSYGVATPPSPTIRSNKGKLKILYLGRFVDFKGPDLVIQAFDRAKKEGLNAELIMAGDGRLMFSCDLLKRRSAYSDDIHFLGETDAITGDRLRQEADIFTAHNCTGVLSNQEEALGVSVLEAMSASLPVISGRNGALTETVVENETGILVEPGDIDEHARAFLKLAQDIELRNTMGAAGWQRVKDYYSYEIEQQKLKNIFGD